MKNQISIIVGVILLTNLLFYCNKPEEQNIEIQNLTAELISTSSCKSFKDGGLGDDSQACVSFIYNESNQTLLITHVNAGFNCCPEEINAQFTFTGDTIIITESEQGGDCDCECLYDLQMQINNLEQKLWYVRFVEPLLNGDNEPLFGYMNLPNTNEGSFCVDRSGYPWGIYN